MRATDVTLFDVGLEVEKVQGVVAGPVAPFGALPNFDTAERLVES